MWMTDMKSQTENWMNILNSYNIRIKTGDNKIPVIIPELKTFLQPMHNLPEDKQLVNRLLDYENKKVTYIPYQIEEMFKEMPFKWLSKVSDRFYGDNDVIIIDEPDDLPQSIKKYVQKYYAKHFKHAGFGKFISSKKKSIINENLGFKDFLNYFELKDDNFSRYEDVSLDFSGDSVYLFDGIAIENFYLLYFKSGLSKEFIFRFLKNDEYAYSIDHQAIEKEVERILSKH